MILAYLLILSPYLSVSLDPDLTDGVVILAYLLTESSPNLSASFDPDLTETAVILAYLLLLSPYFSASFDPDLTETAVMLAYLKIYPHTSQPVLIQI